MTRGATGTRGGRATGGVRAAGDGWRTALYGLVLVLLVGGVVHPLRSRLVEPRRQRLLGQYEPPGRRLAMASFFAFSTVSGASVRLVPGRPTLELADLPARAVTLVLGGFRGPYVAWLWLQAEEEKQRKVHVDLIDRYTKIAALQGDYPQVWVYHIWNMAYNLSVQWHSPERKYQWVRRGLDFGMEGYRRNPHSSEIMAEIGRVYSEKLGRSQEAPYYRRRVLETEGRSPFLLAYEWFDRARKAIDPYGPPRRGLAKPVIFAQACHNLSYYAIEEAQQAYDALKEAEEARRTGGDEAGRAALERGRARLGEAIAAWQWARREWREQVLRFEREGAYAVLLERYRASHEDADTRVRQLEAARDELTYENLPEVLGRMTRPEIR